LRGLLRLVRSAFSDFARENAAIRDAAALLSHLRDAEVLQHTVADLCRQADDPTLQRIAERLAGAALAAPDPQKLGEFRERLRAVQQRAAEWTLTKSGPDAVMSGLRRTYRDDRQRMASSKRTGAATDFHEWRKANKYHGFHLDLLRKLAPELMADDLRVVEQLSDLLGRHHDLTVLAETAHHLPERFGDNADVGVMLSVVAARKAEIEQQAFGLGRQILAERPRALVRRFAQYWSSVA
jgi:CHAD domain-containing protein